MSATQVLIVDDDPALLEALSETLRLSIDELEVETSSSAIGALERISSVDYDALIVDIKMPAMDGLELLSELKQRRPDTPTLLITGHGDHELAVQALRAGAFDYVTKPIDREYFVSSLRRALECHRLGREVRSRREELAQHAGELEACVQERTVELREALYREATARAELDQARAELEELAREREKFVSLIAHDLASPLTTVKAYAELLERSNTSPKVEERARALIVSETRRMIRLANDLAEGMQLTSNRFQISKSSCSLVEIAREQVELARTSTDRHTIRLDAPEDIRIACDRDRVCQVLSNLISNAVKHTSAGEVMVRIWREADEARISVSDEGPGVPSDQTDWIFELGARLSRDDAAKGLAGAGLGLYIARTLAQAHGGQLWVESTPGEGATFHLTLPLNPAGIETANS